MKKKNKKERNPATVEMIAKKFKTSKNYVRSVLKVGDVNPDLFDRIMKGRMALYVAYGRAIVEERKQKQEVPPVSDVNHFEPDTGEQLTVDPTQVEGQEGITGTDPQPASEVTVADAKGASIEEKQANQEDQPTVKPAQVTAPADAVTIGEDNTIMFRCPGECNKTYLIILNANNNE